MRNADFGLRNENQESALLESAIRIPQLSLLSNSFLSQ